MLWRLPYPLAGISSIAWDSSAASCLFITCVDCVTLALEVVGLKHPPRAVFFAPILHRAKFAGSDFWSEEDRQVVAWITVVVAGDTGEVVFSQLCCGCVHIQVYLVLFGVIWRVPDPFGFRSSPGSHQWLACDRSNDT